MVYTALSQEDVRYSRAERQYFPINIFIFKWISPEPLTKRVVSLSPDEIDSERSSTSGDYRDVRTVSCPLLGVEPGQYLIVCSTFEPDCECDFRLQIDTGTEDLTPIFYELE